MPKLRIVMLHVSAIDYGTHYVVVDRNGRPRRRLYDADTGPLSSDQKETVDRVISKIERRIRRRRVFGKLLSRLNSRGKRRRADEWEIKIATWQKSIWLREKHARRKSSGVRFFTRDSRPDWERAYECMLRQYYNKVVRKRRHWSDPWAIWSETVSRNHNRKEQRSESRKDS